MSHPIRPREATIQFNDVYGELPLYPKEAGFIGSLIRHWLPFSLKENAVDDFDAKLTTQVRNTGRWADAQFSIGGWPALGDYGVVLLDQLRQHQVDAYQDGVAERKGRSVRYDPDFEALAQSVGEMAVVGVVNWAPRTAEHQRSHKNGEDFYMGVAASGVEIFAQMRFFRGLHARGRLRKLYLIPNDAGVWHPGEQFRSSIVSQARGLTKALPEVQLSEVPKLELHGRLAYVDKFGNVRLEMRNSRDTKKLFAEHKRVGLEMYAAGYYDKRYGHVSRINVVNHLAEIPEGELGVYYNPADPSVEAGPHYVELVRRVSNPNENGKHAYEALCSTFLSYFDEDAPRSMFTPAIWDDMDMYLVPE